MTEREYSRYQRKVIQRFYDNRDHIDDQKLSELVTSLYLASENQRPRLWQRAHDIMKRMALPQSRIDHVMESQDAAALAKVVEELQNGTLKRGTKKKPKT